MYYEINVSLNGQHFFATTERSIKTEARMLAVYKEIKKRFRTIDGYTVNVTKYETIGHGITAPTLNEEK